MARIGKVENENDRARDAFGDAIASALRDGDARMHLPPDFAARLRRAACMRGAAGRRSALRKAAAIVAMLGLGAFAATVAYRQFVGKASPEQDVQQKGETNMIMARKVAALAGAAVLTVSAPAAKLSSEPTFIFLKPETSSFWNTATNSTMTLPAPDSPKTENVYELSLTFDNGATPRTAKLGLIQGLDSGAKGSTRCIAPASGKVWETAKYRAVLPIPYGTDTFSVKLNGGEWRNVDTGLNGAQGWYALSPIAKGDSVSLSYIADGVSHMASIEGGGDGFFVILK